jgi:DNA-binding transcriptional LysR family regulator
MSGQIEHIRTFLEVVAQSGFAPAARTLGLTPTIVTRHVAELERQLGVQLFTRTTRKVDLTDAGRHYRQNVRQIVDLLDEANMSAQNRQVGLSGPLTVSAPLSFAIRHLPQIVAQFRTLHPGVQLNLQLTDRLVDIAGEGFDMALRVSEPPRNQTTIWRKICAIPRVLIASPTYLARHATLKDPKELSSHQCLHYGDGPSATIWRLHSAKQQLKVPINTCLVSNNGDLIAQMCQIDEGIALLPRFIVEREIERGQLCQVLPSWNAADIWLAAVFPTYEKLPAKVEVFTSFVEAELSDADAGNTCASNSRRGLDIFRGANS